MKVSEIIKEFVPCEVCGNTELKNFYFYVLVNKGPQAYVRCCECGEEYYSISARNTLIRAEESRKARIESGFVLRNKNQGHVHPLVNVLARIYP
ncbi:MAG: hypothetical protein FIB08_04300 [Candidatus Methanoperedens sp.]|nr:hypothetical protein [Candidatus Methanoperedens sp.]